jgi:flagellar basal body-associated protein FliL
MAEGKSSKNKKLLIIVIAIIVIAVVVAIVLGVGAKGDSSDDTAIANDDYNARLQAVQNKIDAQEAVISDMSDEMKPLTDQRTNLEQQLMELTDASSAVETVQDTTTTTEEVTTEVDEEPAE